MPIKRTKCDCCGEPKYVCPDCGSRSVTPRENLVIPNPNELVDFGATDGDYGLDGVEKLDDGRTEVTYEHVCWECGWDEEVTVTVERP